LSTIKDIAKITGLGLATISKYLNGGNVRPENRVAIEQAIDELNYTVNAFARGLKTNRSKTIGIILPELNNTFFLNIVTAIEKWLKNEDYAVIICDCNDNKTLEMEAVKFILNKNVDGIIDFPVSYSGKHLKPALDNNTPILLVDSLIPKLVGKVDSIAINNMAISREIVDLLIKTGHRRIGLITGENEIYTMDNRMKGYCTALEESGIEVNPAYIKRCNYSLQGGYDGFRELVSTHNDVTAVFAANHYLTMGVLAAANELGIKIPDDISIAAFDYMDWHRILLPKLTVVEQPMIQIGQQAAEMMLKRLQNGDNNMPNEARTLFAKIRMGNSIKENYLL